MYYLYHARFQPLSRLHEEEIKILAKEIAPDDLIIIGIVGYIPKFEEIKNDPQYNSLPHDKQSAYMERFDLQFNTLTYWERVEQIKTFIEENNLGDKIPYIIPLPMPSIEKDKISNFIPSEENCTLCLSLVHDDGQEQAMRQTLLSLYRNVHLIRSVEQLEPQLRIISSELICSLIVLEKEEWSGKDIWRKMVSDHVYKQLNDIAIYNRIRHWSYDSQKAFGKIEQLKKYTNTAPEEKILLDALEHYAPNPSRFVNAKFYLQDRAKGIFDNASREVVEEQEKILKYIEKSSGFTLILYEAKISCYKLFIEYINVLQMQKMIAIPNRPVTQDEVDCMINDIEKAVETLTERLSDAFTKIESVKEKDVNALDNIVEKLKQQMEAVVNE